MKANGKSGADPRGGEEGRGPANESRRTLIIVEDDDSCATTLEIALTGLASVRVVRFRRAEEALTRIEQDGGASCCALVTDLELPRMDGFELIETVRKLRPSGFPILVTSGDADPESPRRAVRLGANAFFRKPYSPIEVRQVLERFLHEDSNPTLTV